MHELSICQSLLREAGHVAAAHGCSEVTNITVAIGPLSGVEAPLLERTFAMARAGTVAERAALEIEIVPVVVWCNSCLRDTEVAPNELVCAGCGGWQVELKSGNELLLKRVELARAAA